MAIEAGNKVSTTGLLNKTPFTPKAPDMSRMKVPKAMQAKRIKPTESKIAPPQPRDRDWSFWSKRCFI